MARAAFACASLLGLCFAATAVPRVQAVACAGSPVSANAGTNLDALLSSWATGAACQGVITFTAPNAVYQVASAGQYTMAGHDWTLDAEREMHSLPTDSLRHALRRNPTFHTHEHAQAWQASRSKRQSQAIVFIIC